MATPGSVAPARGEGLKTHISTALSGLLDRAEQGAAPAPVPVGPPAVETSALAREVRRLLMGPTPPRLVLLRAAERAAGTGGPDPYPFPCLYCDCRFESEKIRNRHTGHAHKREIYGRASAWDAWEALEDDPGGGDRKSKAPVTGSLASESGGRPATSGAGAAAGLSRSVATADSVADSPHTPALSRRVGLAAGEEAAEARVAEEPEDSGPPAVRASALARELRRLIRVPVPARLLLRRAAERAAGVAGPDPYPFPCLYCECRFEQQSTCNRHMGRAHQAAVCPGLKLEPPEDGWPEPKVSIWTPDSPGGGDFLCSESKPTVTGSATSESPGESAGRPVTTGAGAAADPSLSVAAAANPEAGAPANSPRAPAGSHCDGLASREEVAEAHDAEEPEDGEAAAGPGRADEARGLKTHIWTTLGGLLGKEKGKALPPSGPGLSEAVSRWRRYGRGRPRRPDTPPRWRRIYATDLAKRVRQHLSRQPSPPAAPRRAPAPGPQLETARYVCLYCDRRFDLQVTQKWHMHTAHQHEIVAFLKEKEEEADSRDLKPTAEESAACEWSGAQAEARGVAAAEAAGSSTPASAAATDPPHTLAARGADTQADRVPSSDPNPAAAAGAPALKTHIWTALGGLLERAAGSRPEQGSDTLGSHVKQEPEDAEPADASAGHGSGWRERSPADCTSVTPAEDARPCGDYLCSDCGANFYTLQEVLAHEKEQHGAASSESGEAAEWQVETGPKPEIETIFIKEETPGEMGPPASPQPEIETIFIKEETSEWESPDNADTAQDPLSFEEEVQEDPVVVSRFSGCIKEEPDVDLTVDLSDSAEVDSRGDTSDITRTSLPGTCRPDPASSHLDGGHADDDTSAPTTGDAAGSVGPDDTKPPFCYAELIAMAIMAAPNRRATLSEICAYIPSRFPYYHRNRRAWRKSIRVNLSLQKSFVKVPSDGRARNNYWTIDPKYAGLFKNRNFRCQPKNTILSNIRAVHRAQLQLWNLATADAAPSHAQAPAALRDGTEGVAPLQNARSSPVNNGNNSASCEEQKHQIADNDEVVTEREKLTGSTCRGVTTRGITSGEKNEVGSTVDSGFPAFTCSSCLQTFSSKYSLVMHVFTHIDGVEPPSHVCTHCGEVFLSDGDLDEHSKARDGGQVSSPCGTSRDEANTGNNFQQAASEGHCCQSSNCSLCQKTPKKPYKCNACSKSFAYACYLQKRANMDYGEKPHKCDVCGKLFSRIYDLKLHLLHHSGLKSLNCDVCDKLFATVDELKSHSSEHCGVNSHKCNICDKSFNTEESLKLHIFTHSVVESHKCDDCGKLFARVGKFEFVLSVQSGPKSLECSVCSLPFRSALSLKRHMQMHSCGFPR